MSMKCWVWRRLPDSWKEKSGHEARFFTFERISVYTFLGGFINIAARTSPTTANAAVG